jgi:hypothetical protein
MTDPSKFVEDTYSQLEDRVAMMEPWMMELAGDYLSGFYVDDTTLKDTSGNYALANQSDNVFDDAYDVFLLAFLLFLGNKIIEGTVITMADFSARGIKPVGDELKLTGKMIGMEKGKIIKGGFLWNVGRMAALRSRFHDYVIKAVSAGQKMNLFLKTARPLFVSTPDKESAFAAFYRKYAYDSVAQSLNSVSLHIADKRGLDSFLYKGGLVKDSRPFCVTHAGNVYTREDAARFDTMSWKGKIPEVPFLIQVAGYNCRHLIQWLPNK